MEVQDEYPVISTVLRVSVDVAAIAQAGTESPWSVAPPTA